MTEAQIQLQNALTTTFLANLAFLSEYDNSLYHRVDELSRMLENGSYKEKYALDFIFENGEFDIYDIVNDKYLYNKNPEKVNNKLIQKIQFDEKNSIVNISEYFLFKEKFYSQNKDKFKFEKREDFITLTQNNIFEYVEIIILSFKFAINPFVGVLTRVSFSLKTVACNRQPTCDVGSLTFDLIFCI